MLSEFIKNCKSKFQEYENDIIVAVVIIAVALISFGLGRLSKIEEERTPVTIEYPATSSLPASAADSLSEEKIPAASFSNNAAEKLFVASKSGKYYHYPWCLGASKIKEENKIWFSSREEAESKGYAPAANCKGL